MLPNSGHRMLEMPKGWERQTGGAIASYLLAQVPDATQKTVLSQCLIHASLDLAVITFFGRNNKNARAQTIAPDHWTIGRMHYFFLPTVDDDALPMCEDILARSEDACIIVPTGFEILLSEALENLLKLKFRDVKSLAAFMSWRVTFAALDANWSREYVVNYLLARMQPPHR